MAVKIFCCYAREDEVLLNRLKKQLKPLQRQALIELWHDRDISAGTEWEQEIKKYLNNAQIILLLLSPDFMASDYCYSVEMAQALERHKRGEAYVISVILRPVFLMNVLGNLQALPTDAKPIMSWDSMDDAFLDIEKGLRKVIENISQRREAHLPSSPEKRKEVPFDRAIEKIIDNQDKSSDLQSIKNQFHQAMLNTYDEAEKIGYHATLLLRMVNEKGGVEAAHLLLAKESTKGFTRLWEMKRLDLSVEALVLKPQFASLFDEVEREKARKRLAEYRYRASWDDNKK